MHLKGLEKMGAVFELESGDIIGTCDRLRGAHIQLDFPTVGGTEHLIMAATLAEGETILENAAREPEIQDLAEFLNSCGARITGHGTSEVRIQGVETDGELTLKECPVDALDAVIWKLREMGMSIEGDSASLRAAADGPLQCVDLSTRPYPGFPTDMQAQIMALMCVSGGAGVITEGIFENRFMHVQELGRLGAHITLSGQSAMVRGQGRHQVKSIFSIDTFYFLGSPPFPFPLVLGGALGKCSSRFRKPRARRYSVMFFSPLKTISQPGRSRTMSTGIPVKPFILK
jgi:UDP-N-acetylglucosamine 1-carboxyvinyltransferase